MFIKNHDKCALVNGQEQVSYSQLIEHIKDYSQILKKYRGKRLALFAENRPEWVYSFFAAWNVGATLVLIDSMCSAEDLEYILKDSGVSALVTSNQNAKTLAKVKKAARSGLTVINVDSLKMPARKTPVVENVPKDSDVVLILYTSGTSGNSKGVLLTWKNIWTNIRWNNDTGRINSQDRMIAVLPTHHSWPLISTILCPMDCGATTVFLPSLDAETLLRTIKENHITMVCAVPRLFELLHEGIMKKIRANIAARALLGFCRFLYILPFNRIFGRVRVPFQTMDKSPHTQSFGKLHEEFGGSVKTFISGGAKLDERIIRDFRAMGIPMLEGYGLTESSPMVTYHPFDKMRIGSVGRVFDDISIRFDDDGEILIKGPTITPGYWKKPADTKAAFTGDGYFRTGDLGRIDSERYLYLTGRKKDLIILSNGKNVRPDLIEEKIKKSSPLVLDIAITQSGRNLLAIVIPDAQAARRLGISNVSEAIKFDVIDEYNRSVESYKKIHEIVISTEELPRTRLGKLKRYKLESFLKQKERKRKDAPLISRPSYEEYRIIERYLEQRSGLKVNPDDHIELDLGLDSLEIVELRLFIEKELSVRIDETEMSRYAIVKDLAEYARDAEKSESAGDGAVDIYSGAGELDLPESRWIMEVMDRLFTLFLSRRLNAAGTGIDRIPEGPCILAPNHQSYLDSLVLYHFLGSRHREDTYFVAKEKNFRGPLMRLFARNSRVIVMDINRNLHESLRKIAEILRRGKKVVIFPEGARTRNGDIQRFKNTFASIAKALDAPVVPVAISGAFEAMPYTKKLPGRGNIKLEFLDPVYPGRLTEEKIVKKTFDSINNILIKERNRGN
jgi:long-chain acyl-CoA synthetase